MNPSRPLPSFDPAEPRPDVTLVVSQVTYQENRWRLQRYGFELDEVTGLMRAPFHPRLRYYLEREGLPFREEEEEARASSPMAGHVS